MEGYSPRGVSIPIFLPIDATFFAPISHTTLANTVFTDSCDARSKVIAPRPLPSLFDTTQGFGLVGIWAGDEESIRYEGGMPSLRAVTRTNVLNAEPGCRFACVTRLNLFLL